jgi:hypothetical protein
MTEHGEVTMGVINGEGGVKKGVTTTLTRETYPLFPMFPHKFTLNPILSNKPRYLDGVGITTLSR